MCHSTCRLSIRGPCDPPSSQEWAGEILSLLVNWRCAVWRKRARWNPLVFVVASRSTRWCWKVPWEVFLQRFNTPSLLYHCGITYTRNLGVFDLFGTHWNLGPPTERECLTQALSFFLSNRSQMLHVLYVCARLPALIQRKQKMQQNHPKDLP